MKTVLTATAFAALLAATPALAQTVAPMPGSTTPAAPMPGAAATMPSPAAVTFVADQKQGQLLANDTIGKTVYNRADETLGEINDILFDANGQVMAVVIGVGGFLGIGEKDVAVPYATLQPMTIDKKAAATAATPSTARPAGAPAPAAADNRARASDTEVRLVLDASRDTLKNAPEFMSLYDKDQPNTVGRTTTTTPGEKR